MTAAETAVMRKALRQTFWKMIFRGRSAQQMRSYKARKKIGVVLSLTFYGLFGLFPASAAFQLDPLTYASLLHACTLMFASLTLASNGITTLFMREESEILLHRPVPPKALLRAKIGVLTVFSMILALSLNLAGLIGGMQSRGMDWRFIPAHIVSTALLMIFATSAMVMAYNACLKYIGPERLDNQISSVQAIVIILMLVGGLALPGFVGPQPMQNLKVEGYGFMLPPVWFGALDMMLCGAAPWQEVWIPAMLAIGSTALMAWVGFVKLGSAYGVGLLALSEGGLAAVSKPRPDREPALSAMLKLPPFSWWLEDAVERQSFMLVSAYMSRDREMKLKLYPGIAPFLVMPLAMLFTMSNIKHRDAMIWVQAFAACYLAIVPIQAMLLLNRSEHWRAAGVFQVAPVRHWGSFFHGARKAVLCWLTYPLVLLLGIVMALIQQSIVPLAMVLPALIFLPAFSLVPGLKKVWLPLALPMEDQQDVGTGCLLMAIVGGLAIVIGGVATWMWKLGGAWFMTFLACEALVMLGLFRLGKEDVERRVWEPEE
jgi:ABC-2 type transport system permease protein